MDLRMTFRYTVGATVLVVSQSLIFGLATLPALVFWQYVFELSEGVMFLDPYGRYVFIATSLIPSYAIFAVALMYFSAGWNRLVGWHSPPGEFSIHDANWDLVKWASYNASIQLVRVFCGEVLRTTPMWTSYLRLNGAKIGYGVYVNSARLFDHNLLVIGDKAVVGGDAKLVAHLVEGGKVKATPVRLGKRAVVGINTVLSPGVTIGDGAAVGAMSFVPKHTTIPPNQIWGGVPARPVKDFEAGAEQPGVPVVY